MDVKNFQTDTNLLPALWRPIVLASLCALVIGATGCSDTNNMGRKWDTLSMAQRNSEERLQSMENTLKNVNYELTQEKKAFDLVSRALRAQQNAISELNRECKAGVGGKGSKKTLYRARQ
jgi:septal ring factor EnvC (AmiA/AmiB activator)